MKNEIAKLARGHKRVQSIMPYVNMETLADSFKKQPDSVEKERYGDNLETNIKELYRRMKAFSYFPQRINGNLKMGNMGAKKEFKIFEDNLVADVFKEILEALYSVKGSMSILPKYKESGSTAYLHSQRIPLPRYYTIGVNRSLNDADKEMLIAFLEENIADRSFMRYVNRFLQSGILECGNMLEEDSREQLSSTLIKIFCYCILREWLTLKRIEIRNSLYFSINGDNFLFVFSDRSDESRIKSMMLRERSKLGSITICPMAYRFVEMTRRPVKRTAVSDYKFALGKSGRLPEAEIKKTIDYLAKIKRRDKHEKLH